jgi:iron complex outermembrane recepter protein
MVNKPTVFLIDDDTDDQEIFSLALERTGKVADCIFANDGLEALELIRSDNSLIPDFIFIDLNMPRMNGQQCLSEIKKIDRLKDVPVYMYSTASDPHSIEENKKLGATDFIVKPSDVNALTSLLRNILFNNHLSIFILFYCLTFLPFNVKAQDTLPVTQLKKLSVEELMNIVVTSVSKTPEKLTEVASAIQVVTGEEIRRSGSPRIPGALRLAPNLQVAQSGSHDWGITSRGFNGLPITSSSLSNKLLVMIDGRTVYTPLFGGVFWDVQNVLLEDVEQLEVISGPGGALWGANSVNGIIHVKTKSAKETQGVYASGGIGTLFRDFGAFRYGSHIDSTVYFRVYGQRMDFSNVESYNSDTPDANDGWNMNQGGFRMDMLPQKNNMITLQGDLYAGEEDDSNTTKVNGQNILGRWTHNISETSSFVLQLYLDRTYRSNLDFTDEIDTYDGDFQHGFAIGKRNKFLWGANYRISYDEIETAENTILPAHRNLDQYSVFLQDQITLIPEHLELTIGSKALHNNYSDLQFHPTVRLSVTPEHSYTIWTAVSGAVRNPTRFDADNYSITLGTKETIKSEKVIAYEFGYRVRPFENLSFSLALFYNQYSDLRSIDTNNTPPPYFYFSNNLEANTYGIEVSCNLIATGWWKLRGGYSYLKKEFEINSSKTLPESYLFEAIDPEHQVIIQSMMDLGKHFQFDVVGRYVDVLPAAFNIPSVPSYITFDLRAAYKYKLATISITGQSLAEEKHREFGMFSIPRSVYAKLSLNF